MEDYMKIEFPAKSTNESFARSVVGAFATRLDITIEELADIKTAVSEAVTNAVVHAYKGKGGTIEINCQAVKNQIHIEIKDFGCGIKDVEQAMQPLFSGSNDEDRSGMGFTVMDSFMDHLEVISSVGHGTTVRMYKNVGETYEA